MRLHRGTLQYFVFCVWFLKIPGSHSSSEWKTGKLTNKFLMSEVEASGSDEWTVLENAIKSRLANIPPKRDTTSETSKTLQKLGEAIRSIGAGLINIPQYNVIKDLFLKIVENHSLDDHFPDFASSFQYSVLPTAIQSENLMSSLLKSKLETSFPKAIDDSAQLHEEEVTIDGNYESPCAFIDQGPMCYFRKWISTGLYAKQGQLIKVTVPSNVVGKFRISIGSHTDKTDKDNMKRWLNFQNPLRPCCISQFYDKDLIKSETRLLSAYGGLIYVDITAPSQLGTFTLKFDKVITSPTFTEGKTTNEQWSHMLASTKSPMVELEVPGVVVTIPKYFFENAPLDMERCSNRFAKLMEAFFDMEGYVMPAPHRYVYDLEGTIGGAHSGYPIMDEGGAYTDGAYSKELLQLANGTNDHHIWNIWAIPHEIGHNIQSKLWTADGLWETTNNIFVQYVNEVVFNENPNNMPSFMYVEKFKENGKKFDSLDAWAFLNIFLMVKQECSWKTFKNFFKYYNEEIPEALIPKTKEERYSLIARVLSEKCNKNLIPFFKWWNWPVLDDAEEATEDLPKWEGIIDLLENARIRVGDGTCYEDDDSRLLDDFHSSATNTPDECIETCSSREYSYAGVQYGNECWCGNDKPPASRVFMDSSQCNARCPGDTSLYCGGYEWAMNVYTTIKTGCLKETNTDYYGVDMGSKQTSGEGECAKWCGSTDGCTVWSLREDDNWCWIRNGDIYAIDRTNFISGEKSCAYSKNSDEWTVLENAIKSRLANIPPKRDTTSETSKTLQKLGEAIRKIGAGLIKIPQYNAIKDLFLKIVENHSLDDHFPDFASSFQYSVLPTAIQSENLVSSLLKSKLETTFPKAIEDSAQLHEEEVTIDGNYESPCGNIDRGPMCYFRKWISTGLYAKQGQLIKVTVPSNVVGKFRISIGSHTDKTDKDNMKRWLNFQNPLRPCCITQFYDKDLIKSETRLLSAYGGLIYVDITAPSQLGTFTLKFDKVITTPTFTEGKTTNEQWSNMLDSTKSPMVELEVPGVVVTIPKYFLKEDPVNMERCANRYAKLMEAYFDMEGYVMPAPHRYVYDLEGTIGGAHNGYPIMDGAFFNELVQLGNGTHDHHISSIWAIPHEIGHNIQNGMWTPRGLHETTNNIFAQYVNEVVFNENPKNVPSLKYVKKFKENGKKFDSLGDWDFLNIFIIVKQECSWKTFKKFFKYYNEEITEALIPKTKEERYSLITRVLSEKCNKNLIPFFKWWNWPVLDDAEEATEDLPKWEGIIDLLEKARKHIGDGTCYEDDDSRLLDDFHNSATNTPEECIETCAGREYSYAGVQYGNECWCGNDKPPASRVFMDSSQCNAKCPGDASLYCGGYQWGMNVYTTIKTGCVKESNTDYYGFDMGSKQTGGESECAKWCGSTDGCTVWSLREDDNWCWIRNGDIYAIDRTNFISGEKSCATEDV